MAGIPWLYKIVAPKIQDFFDGSVAKFLELLKQGTFVFDDIRSLLERQFNRLSDLEKEVMYWLAIKREPVSFPEVQAAFADKVRQSEILEAIASLHRRSLIEKSADGFTQQPVVMEYITDIELQCLVPTRSLQVSLLPVHQLYRRNALKKQSRFVKDWQ